MINDSFSPDRAPNPVTQIIRVRTLQVGFSALALLVALQRVVPPAQFARMIPFGGMAVSGGLSAYFAATFSARFPMGGSLMVHLPHRYGHSVALTFDDGPHPQTTPLILDILAARNAQATFFVIGEAVSRYPQIVRRIAQEGHTIGIHGLHHRTMVLQSGAQIRADVQEVTCRIEAATGQPLVTRYLRPPYGFKSWTLGRAAQRMHCPLIAWSLDPRDYGHITAQTLLSRVESRLAPGEIILLHERPEHPITIDALPDLIRMCEERSLACVGL